MAKSPLFDAYRNLAMEDALCREMRPGDVALFLWQNRAAVVIGRGQNAWREVRCAEAERDGVQIARRTTGGGAVLHDMGNLNFSFCTGQGAFDAARQTGVITTALRTLGVDAVFSGRNDILLPDGRKVSGSAFRHERAFSLHHGTLLIDSDLSRMARYLTPGERKLRANGVRSVEARVANLSGVASVTVSGVEEALAGAFQAEYGAARVMCTERIVDEETARRFASWEWRYGAAPDCETVLENRFSFGSVEIRIGLKDGVIERVAAYTDAMDPHLSDRIERAISGRRFGQDAADALTGAGLDGIGDWLRRAASE